MHLNKLINSFDGEVNEKVSNKRGRMYDSSNGDFPENVFGIDPEYIPHKNKKQKGRL